MKTCGGAKKILLCQNICIIWWKNIQSLYKRKIYYIKKFVIIFGVSKPCLKLKGILGIFKSFVGILKNF